MVDPLIFGFQPVQKGLFISWVIGWLWCDPLTPLLELVKMRQSVQVTTTGCVIPRASSIKTWATFVVNIKDLVLGCRIGGSYGSQNQGISTAQVTQVLRTCSELRNPLALGDSSSDACLLSEVQNQFCQRSAGSVSDRLAQQDDYQRASPPPNDVALQINRIPSNDYHWPESTINDY